MTSTATRRVIRILDPVGVVEPAAEDAQPVEAPSERARDGVRSLHGAVLGVVTNVFRGYDVPGAVAERMGARIELADTVTYRKPSISHPTDPAIIADLAERVDVALVGLCA